MFCGIVCWLQKRKETDGRFSLQKEVKLDRERYIFSKALQDINYTQKMVVYKVIENKRLILVGGTGRNVGKTEFVCRLIQQTAELYNVYALKVSAIFPDEEVFHGHHGGLLQSQRLFEETRFDTPKDTSRMLRAGAKRVFYLQSDDEFIESGYLEFCNQVPEGSIVICESNSLGYHVKPGLHIIIKGSRGIIKPRAKNQLKFADLIITSDEQSGFPELDSISINSRGIWALQVEREQVTGE